MIDNRWRPLSKRQSADTDNHEELYEGVPDWMRPSLIGWAFRQPPSLTIARKHEFERIGRVLHLSLNPIGLETSLAGQLTEELLLDLVDYCLTHLPRKDAGNIDDLEAILSESGSAWRVVRFGKVHALGRRLLPETEAIAKNALQVTGNASGYMQLAWRAAFGRNPEPNVAFENSIKAIEAVLIPIVLPDDRKPTLGKIIAAMDDKPDKWSMRLRGTGPNTSVVTYAAYLQTVWASHLRHAETAKGAKLAHDLGEARDATIMAAQVLQLVSDGGLVAV